MSCNYIIATGWWCDNSIKKNAVTGKDYDQSQLSPYFFETWLNCVDRFLSPEKIIMIDSASPVPANTLGKIEVVNMKQNFLHAKNCRTKLCGWSRAFLIGAFYAMMNDSDYVYLEQDVLFWGDIVGRAFEHLGDSSYSHGLWNHKYKVEQSFVVIKKEYIHTFINAYLSINKSDRRIRPELKFHKISENTNTMFKELPFGYGRSRPINFEEEFFYAQHLSTQELEEIRRLYDT
jgi:hypothetical protein